MSASRPRVSVVIPVYRREALVGDAIESALAQTFQDLEVVVVDNASPDQTYEVCCEYAQRDPRVRVLRNETNVGPVRNWRRGIQEARGELVKLLFSDDTLAPTFLARTVPLLKDDVAFVATVTRVIAEAGQEIRLDFQWKPQTGLFESAEYLEALLSNRVSLPLSPGAALFRRQDLLAHLLDVIPSPGRRRPSGTGRGGHDVSAHGAGADLLLFLLAAKQYPRVGFVAEPQAVFREHGGGLTTRLSDVVKDSYAVAEVWFARAHCSARTASTVWAFHWFRLLARRRALGLLGQPPSYRAVPRAAARELARYVRSHL